MKIDWEKAGKNRMHPTQRGILEWMATTPTAPWSPKELSDRMAEPLGNVSYHVKCLLDFGELELERTEPRRGAVEHFYRIVGAK